ncbi:MAG: TolB family protein [Fidelibacterota bacterium]
MIKKVKKKPYLIYVLILCFFVISCNISPDEDDNGNGVKPPTPVYPDIDKYPSWSPDGNVIVYYHTGVTSVESSGLSHVNPDSVGLWFISPTGDNKRQFLKGNNRTPAWSPDGNWIAFVNDTQIYKIKADGDSLTQLTFEGRNFFPAWSPDGEWIAYDNTNCGSAVEPAPPNSCGVLIIESSGSDKQFIIEGRMPDWSPDGEYIIYVGLHSEIYRVNVNDTTEIVQLTSLNQNDIYATDNRYLKYSPDGSKIVFASNAQIWVMDSDGTNLLQLTQSGGNYPVWSPDGNYIVFTRNNFAEFGDENGRLWIMDSNGDNKRQLTFMNK